MLNFFNNIKKKDNNDNDDDVKEHYNVKYLSHNPSGAKREYDLKNLLCVS